MPWDKTFDAIVDNGYNEWLVIEAFGLALPELAAATKIWRRMYRDEMTLASEGLAFTNPWLLRPILNAQCRVLGGLLAKAAHELSRDRRT